MTSAAALAGTAKEQIDSMRRRQLLCAWSGPFFVLMFFIGLVLFMGFVPPTSPLDSGEEIAATYTDDLTQVRVGIVICSLSVALMASWGASIAARTKRTEREFPVFTYTQLGCIGCGVMVAVLCFLIWAVAAFRPGEIEPETTRVLHDIGWYLFLFDVAPFMVWMVAVGLAVLMNKSEYRLFPRWVGYLSLWAAFGEAPAVLILFFKDGAFAYNGAFGFWLPLIAFFFWVMITSWAVIHDVNEDARTQLAELAEVDPAPAAVPVG